MSDQKKQCPACGKEPPQFNNYCDWDCHIAHARALGGKEHLPNGLPIACIMHDGTMLEIGHGDHPDYKFPVNIEFFERLTPGDIEDAKLMTGLSDPTDAEVRNVLSERHALIYADRSAALTLYECEYFVWKLLDGTQMKTPGKPRLRLTQESITEIVTRLGL